MKVLLRPAGFLLLRSARRYTQFILTLIAQLLITGCGKGARAKEEGMSTGEIIIWIVVVLAIILLACVIVRALVKRRRGKQYDTCNNESRDLEEGPDLQYSGNQRVSSASEQLYKLEDRMNRVERNLFRGKSATNFTTIEGEVAKIWVALSNLDETVRQLRLATEISKQGGINADESPSKIPPQPLPREIVGSWFVNECRSPEVLIQSDSETLSDLGLGAKLSKVFLVTDDTIADRFHRHQPDTSYIHFWCVEVGECSFLLPGVSSSNSMSETNGFDLESKGIQPSTLSYCLPALLKPDGDYFLVKERGYLSSVPKL